MSKNCIITTVKSKIKGNATSYIERENEIFIPVSKKFSLKQTRAIAQDKVNSINKEYLSEKFGNVVSLNTSYTDGTGINIHPSQLLIDAYEVKEGNKSIEELNPRNLDYFNGDEALLEQEQREFNFDEKEFNFDRIKLVSYFIDKGYQNINENNFTRIFNDYQKFLFENPQFDIDDFIKLIENNEYSIQSDLNSFIDESKKIADEIKDVEQQVQEEKIIKPGVSELFEENPELANSVYSALNFKVNKHVNKKYYDSYNNSLKLFSKGKNLNILNNIPFNIINAPNHIKEKYQVATTISEKIWEDDVIGEFKDFSDSVFLKIKYDEEYGTFDLFKSTKFNEFSKEYELIEEDLSYNIIKKLLSYSSPALTYMEEQAKITQQQKATAQQLYSQYLEQNPNGSVEQFKSWVDEFNRKTNLEKTSENKTIEELYKENPKLEEFINSVTDEDNTTLSLYKVKNLLNQKGEGRIVKLNNILYNAIMRLWDNNVFAQNNIKIYFVDSLPENAVGNFNRDDNEITIDKTKFLNIVNNSYQQDEIFYLGYILNHEIIHYLTPNDLSLKIEYIDRALEGRFGKTFELPSEKEFGKNIKELYDIANSQIEDVSDYGFTNLAEFVAEAMSNPNFQEKLASVPYKSTKKSLWKRFIEIVSAYLTKYTGKPINDTLLEAVLAEVTNYITENSNIQKTYKIRNKKNDVFFDFVFTTQKNINSLSDFISQKSQERLIQIEEVFNENPDFSSQIYEALGFNQLITSNDKIVFGHPGIGKTFAKKYNDFIDVDEDYKEEHTMQKILRANAKNTGKKEDLKEWENYVTVWWNKVKTDAKKSGKQIFVSNLPILRMFSQDFDKVITMSKDTFTSRAKQRNDYIEGETEDWKNSLDIEIAKIDKSKVFNTDKYLSNLFITTQQKQQAISKFQEYVNATGRQDIEGFKEFVGKSSENSIQFNVSPNEVSYQLKSIEILSSQKADEIFRKGDKNGWSIDKILTELQIPKEQKQLLLSFNTRNREELLTNLLANYSYTVEINTAKDNIKDVWVDEYSNKKIGDYITIDNQQWKILGTRFEDDSWGKSGLEQREAFIVDNEGEPTQHYSPLTVPGGTNGSYREQNFETPLIKVPKSHAQFNTENTIGFSRNDDRQIYTEKDVNSLLEVMQKSGILEIKC